jgi:predicted alpha/beta hydrolase family esterase
MRTLVLFIQGGGEGAHKEDALLAASLQKGLGVGYDVRYPQMSGESDPDMQTWKDQIKRELAALEGKVILVGHSVGAAALLKYLSEENVERPIAGLFLLAAPSRDEKNWNFDNLQLPSDLAAKLSGIPRVFLYHNRDDEIVPFSHLALHAARLPRAVVREGDKGGHQFGNDLANVAIDIRRVTQAAGTHSNK